MRYRISLAVISIRVIIIVLGSILVSCENRWNLEVEMNLPPSLSLLKDGRELSSSDSLKMSLKHRESYEFRLRLIDENLYYGTWEITKGEGILVGPNDDLIGTDIWRLSDPGDSLLTLIYQPSTLGEHILEFRCIDPFGEETSTSLTLEVFENLLPVAVLEVSDRKVINQGHYVLDGSSSFDLDRPYGGSIEWYRFLVSDRIIGEGISPSLEYIFQSQGTYTVSLEVQDSDGAVDKTSTTLIID